MPRAKKEKPNRSDGLYEVKITTGRKVDGTLIRKSFYSSSSKLDAKKKAERYLIEKEVAERTIGQFVDQDVTFKDWAIKWLETYKKGKVKGNTYSGTYEYPVKSYLIPAFGEYFLRDIKPIDIQDFFDGRRDKNALETLNKMKNCLKAIFDTAIENDLCYKNPVTRNLHLSSTVAPIKKDAYTQQECDKVMKYAESHPYGLAIMVLLETGISRSELLGLKWDDIDWKESVMYINQGTVSLKDPKDGKYKTVSDGLKNSYRKRFIPISRKLLDKLLDKPCIIQTKGQKVHTEYIFHNPSGKVYHPKSWVEREYNIFMQDMHKETGVKTLHCHELRHTKATLLKDSGVDLFSIAKLMGHSNLDMLSKRYAHNSVEALKKALGMDQKDQ